MKLSNGTIIRAEVFGVIVGKKGEFYEVMLYGHDSWKLQEKPVLLEPADMFPCRKPPKLRGIDDN